MKTSRFVLVTLIILFFFPAIAHADSLREASIIKGREAAKALGSALKEELLSAIEKEGPIGALEVCNEKAPDIARSLSQKKGMKIGRTALRVRNQANTPDRWEKLQLESFVQRLQAGEDAGELESYTLMNDHFRYMKAIPMQGLCATCHGEAISSELENAIKDLYPQDQATGYAPGEIRGAFTVSIPVQKID